MRVVMAISLGLLLGCNTPGPDFRDIRPVRISVGKSTFDVRVDGTRAQAIRLTPEWAPRLAAVAPRGVAAIEAVSGCKVRKLDGDQAVLLARLDCGGPLQPLPRSGEYDCEFEHVFEGFGDLICEPAL